MTTPFDLLNRLHSVAPHRITGTPEADAARTWLTQYLSEQGLEPELVDFHYRAPGLLSRFAMLLNAWVTPLLGFFALALDPWIGLAALAALNLFDFVLAPKIGRARSARGVNVLVGVNRPWAEMATGRRPLVIVTAHTDTARAEPPWLRRLGSSNDTLYSLAAIGVVLLVLFWLTTGLLGLWSAALPLVIGLRAFWDGVGRWVMSGLCVPIASSVSVWVLQGLVEHELVNPGADDNGSGVAVALDLASALKVEHAGSFIDIALAFVDAEEVGLRGTRDLVERFGEKLDPELTTIVNLDCVGRGDTLVSVRGQGLIRQRRPDPATLALWVDVSASHARSHASIWMTFFSGGTDQDAWLARGFRRALSISHGDITPRRLRATVYRAFGIVADPVDVVWSHLHSPTDSLAGISPAALAETRAAILAFIRALGALHDSTTAPIPPPSGDSPAP